MSGQTGEGHGAPNPLDRIKRLLECTSTDAAIVQWVCSQAGGYFVENPKSKLADHEKLFPRASKTMEQVAELLAEINQAVEDGKVTHEESVMLRKDWEKVKSLMETFISFCESGEFRQPTS